MDLEKSFKKSCIDYRVFCRKLKNEMDLEKSFKKSCKDYGIFCRKLNTTSPGMPDMLLIKNRQTILCELKYIKKETDCIRKYLTISQIPFYTNVLGCSGAIYICAYIKSINSFILILVDSIKSILNLDKPINETYVLAQRDNLYEIIQLVDTIEFGVLEL
jgi:hypothetical protein